LAGSFFILDFRF